MLEEILDYRNIQKALQQVMSNKGAGGIDGMATGELPEWLERHWKEWKESAGDTLRQGPVTATGDQPMVKS